ncbi:MAG: DUF1552 domain-containing protein [Bryobacteraceae bacterium]|jgi:hypothetical protein
MFVTKKHLSRRTVLRGMSVTLGLPLLDAMVPAQTPLRQTAAGARRTRLACIEMVHGAAGSAEAAFSRHYWSPALEGADFEFSYSLEALAPFRDYITIVSGTDARQADAFEPAEVGADHFRSSAVFLTAAHPKQTDGVDLRNGISIDQLYAQTIAQDSPCPSIQLGVELVDPTGSYGYRYSAAYSDAISWGSPTTPLHAEINPRVVFEKLFGSAPAAGSILDLTAREAESLKSAVGLTDARRIEQYQAEIRDVERRIQAIERHNAGGEKRELAAAPLGVPDSWEEHVKLMFDLQLLAFAAEITRVSSFKMSHDVSNRIFPESGVKTPFHSLSHHEEKPARIAEFAKLNRYHAGRLCYFLEKLKDTPDGDGSLLDHALVLYGSPMGDSQSHNHRRVPLFLAGRASGQLKGNLHRVCPPGTPQANALLTVAHKLGVDVEQVGDSTGEIVI